MLPESSFPDLRLASTWAHSGRHLPRWEASGAVYHATFHLADSIPAGELRIWRERRQELLAKAAARHSRSAASVAGEAFPRSAAAPAAHMSAREGTRSTDIRPARSAAAPAAHLSDSERAELRQLYSDHVEKYLSAGYGACWLRRPGIAQNVAATLKRRDGLDYALHVWCIMPNHVHVVFGGLRDGVALGDVIAQWKRVTAHAVNRIAGRTGIVWHEDSYTRIIRDAGEYRRQVDYVWNNPESAGLVGGYLRERYANP